MGLLLTFLYVAYILANALIGRIIGKGRFFIVRYRVAEIDILHSRYGAWVGKMFATVSSVGFFALMIRTAFFEVSDAIAYAANDWTEAPYFIAAFGFGILSAVFYLYLTEIIKSAELKFHFPKRLDFAVRSQEQDGKIILDAWDVRRAMRLAKKAMSQEKGVFYASKTELDLIDISTRADLKRTLNRAAPFYPFSKVPWLERRMRAQAEVRPYPVSPVATVGNLAVEVAQKVERLPVVQVESKPEKKLTPEERLEQQLSVLSEGDRELIRSYIARRPELMDCILSTDVKVRFKFIEDEHGRRIKQYGITFRK